jgi:HK97 gp10 family phage protein
MADTISYKLTGADALSAKFRELSLGVRSQVAVPAAKDAMQIVLADAQDRASRVDDPETRNYLPKNIALVEQKTQGAELGAAIVSVGFRKTRAGQRGGNTFYWWWVELGTEFARAQPMLRPALSNNREAVFKEFLSSAKFQLLKLGEA